MSQAATAPPDQIDAEFVRGFVDRWLEAWNSRDPEQIVDLCTEDTRWEEPVLPPVSGKDAIREYLVDLFGCFPDMVMEAPFAPYIDLDGRKAALVWRLRGTMLGPAMPTGFAPTNARVVGRGVDIYEFRDGLLSDYWMCYDLVEYLRQMGMMPEPGSRGEKMAVRLQRLGARRLRRKHKKLYASA